MPRIVVDVMLKPEILDPQGRAVQGALSRLGLTGVTSVRQGKRFEIELDGELDEALETQLEELAGTLLSNPVIEDWSMYQETEAACDCEECTCEIPADLGACRCGSVCECGSDCLCGPGCGCEHVQAHGAPN